MPFLGSQPAEAALTTGDLGDDIVTLAKIASGTDGELITWDASGNPAAVGAGTSGHFLKSQGAGSVPVFAAAGGGKVVQVVHTQVGSSASGSTTMPGDNTTPQNSEGVEFITRAITPTNASNKLLIQAFLQCTFSSGGDTISYALFQDSTAGALASGIEFNDSTNVFSPLALTHYMTAGTTSETTFKVRVGTNSSGTMYLNKTASGGDMHNGLLATTMTIWEISV
jgi:hypothetical protein